MATDETNRRRAEAEDRILRYWTPLLLRTILLIAIALLVGGLLLTACGEPHYIVNRYRQAQLGHLLGRESFSGIWRHGLAGQPHAILTLGLYALTLVPLARVAFCLMLFIKQRDLIYVALTAYVLAGLIAGIVLGRAG
jgi:uncharacterized membrane protein